MKVLLLILICESRIKKRLIHIPFKEADLSKAMDLLEMMDDMNWEKTKN